MTTLADLREALFPAARPLLGVAEAAAVPGASARSGASAPLGVPAPPAEPPAEIAWVRVMRPRVPAFDALEAGDLAIVPASALAVVAPTMADLGALVGALSAAPVSGVLLLEGGSLVSDAGPGLESFAAALSDAGVAGLRLPAADPSTIERSVIGLVVGRMAELERQAAILEAELARRALAGEGIEAVLGAAASFLARPLGLEAARGERIAVNVPPGAAPGDVESAAAYLAGRGRVAAGRAEAGRVAAGPGAAGRVPLPAGGAIVILGARPPADLDLAALSRVAGLVALELARDEAIGRAAGHTGRGDALPAAGPPWVVVLARQRGLAGDDDGGATRSAREQLRRGLRLLAPARRLALRGDVDSLEIRLVVAPPDEDLTHRIATQLGRPIAVSRPFASPGDRPAAEAEARQTLEAALALGEPPAIARADRLAAYRLMGALHNLADGTRLARALLEPALGSRPDVRRERLATLRAILERGGINEAAAALGVHRNTVAYRLHAVEARTGWRLSDPELRLPLAIALELVHEDQV